MTRPDIVRCRFATLCLSAVLMTGCSGADPTLKNHPRAAGERAARVRAVVDAFAAETLAKPGTAGISIAVASGSETLLMRGYGYADVENRVPATADTAYRISSISKQFVAAAIMRLAEEGRIRLEDPLPRYLPEFADYADGVTIHHLLTHTSGLPGGPDPPWEPEMTRKVSMEELLERLRKTPVRAAPGEQWVYNNAAFILLSAIIERVTGTTYVDYLRETLFEPLGMTSTVYCSEPPPIPGRAKGYVFDEKDGLLPEQVMNMSVVGAGGAYCSTLSDLLRWQRALVGNRIVTRESYTKMTTPVTLNDGTTEPYGYALGIRPVDGERGISHGGGIRSFWSYLSHYPDRDLHIVVLINSGGVPSRPLAEELARRVFAAQRVRAGDGR